MKTFRLIGMALFAVLVSVGFTACSNDDDDDNGGTTSGKRLVKMTEQGESKTYTYDYSYDSQGRIIKKEENNGNRTYKYVYTYTDNLIVQKSYYSYDSSIKSEEHSFTLENGLIVSGEDEKNHRYQYTYEDGRLATAKEENNVYSYIWENGNIIRIDRNGEIYKKYEYTNYTAPQGFITPSRVEEDLGLFYGKSSKNLPSKCTEGDDEQITYDWTLKDGLPIKLIEMEKSRGMGDTDTYYTTITTFEWE